MFKNKLFNIALIIMIAITLLGVAAVAVYKLYINPPNAGVEEVEPLSIDEILELSVETEEMTTNLYGGGYVRLKMKLQADNKKSKEELEKRLFQVDHIILKTLAGMTEEEIRGPEGLRKVEEQIRSSINELLQEGQVTEVTTTRMIIQ
ncbi:flagellar basal body-associated protein FliL [Ammoniphilus sp. CFH 90114]|uniref:flagellar basal body-associated protein FliL n=1 Tax=Ammoniphilus sp. CFH 90114 TaxID=2493665 RepID=UPI00100EDF61|nr:flagellar basal body-associated protein FliL [Ammoniphilus sp. CFH 90114]RXT15122.1 flagellar basal body-associated protein FliL [Ammoniphilus sp. CFH 90114]